MPDLTSLAKFSRANLNTWCHDYDWFWRFFSNKFCKFLRGENSQEKIIEYLVFWKSDLCWAYWKKDECWACFFFYWKNNAYEENSAHYLSYFLNVLDAWWWDCFQVFIFNQKPPGWPGRREWHPGRVKQDKLFGISWIFCSNFTKMLFSTYQAMLEAISIYPFC